jgi:hypothetical protein
VVVGTEDEQLLFIVVPVGAKASKDGRTVVQRMGKDANIRLFIGDNAAFEECVVG